VTPYEIRRTYLESTHSSAGFLPNTILMGQAVLKMLDPEKHADLITQGMRPGQGILLQRQADGSVTLELVD
jgi:hypothetical protein